MLRRALLLLAFVSIPWQAEAGRRAPERLLQAPEAHRGWVLAVDGQRATIESTDGSRRSFRLRRDERLLGFSELQTGWVATGIQAGRDSLDLTLIADFGRGTKRLASPAERTGSLRTGPAPLVDRGRLAGLAWLEGDDLRRFAVRVADLDQGAFSEARTVSPPQAGSQSGLTATVLADGTWLLVWARFDGRDDELYWAARRPDGEWSAPRRVAPNNATPDVTPHLLPHGDGALLAWSQLRGEYEVMTARFDGSSWTAPTALGVRGTLAPSLLRRPEADYLMVRNAWPGGWTAFRLDADGRPLDFAAVAEESRDRPILRSVPGQGLAFEWPHRDAAQILRWEPAP